MARPLRIEYPGAFYHITSRGNERKNIFQNDRDRARFLTYLESAVERYRIAIHTYCLMNNHYHLLLETPHGNLSRTMLFINGAYTTYFNTVHRRSGHLFQGRYKAILVERDSYALELSRYIHLNPVRAGLVRSPEEYRWSSYSSMIDYKKKPKWLETDLILGLFSIEKSAARAKYQKFVEAMVSQIYESPLRNVIASAFLGEAPFIQMIKDRYVSELPEDREIPTLRELKEMPAMKEIEAAVESVCGKDSSRGRHLTMYFCHRYSGQKLKDIGNRFGVVESTVSQISRRIKERAMRNEILHRQIEEIKEKLNLSRVKT